MYAVKSEEKYTIAEAKRIIEAEREEKREMLLYKAKQKLLGIFAIAISIITPVVTGDATISLLMLPLGLYLIFTKDKTIY